MAGTAFESLMTTLKIVQYSLDSVPVPGLKIAVGGILDVLRGIEAIEHTEDLNGFNDFLTHLTDLLGLITSTSGAKHIQINRGLNHRIEKLTNDIEKTVESFEMIRSRGAVLRSLATPDNIQAIIEINESIKNTIDVDAPLVTQFNSQGTSHLEVKDLPPPPNIDDHNIFWSTYDKVACAFDAELLNGWNRSLDILLIFAGLFSAVNTAFIIESYKGLQPDPEETTHALLRILIIHRNDNLTLTDDDLSPQTSLNPSAVPLNIIFFTSLLSSLSAAFGAVAAKQWLTEYANMGSMKTLHAQGRERQAKFMGLQTWQFRFIMELLPMLLQVSLLLFLIGVIQFLWVLDRKVAGVQLVLGTVGVAIYLNTIVIGIIFPTSPFQTPMTKFLARNFTKLWRYGVSHRLAGLIRLIIQRIIPQGSPPRLIAQLVGLWTDRLLLKLSRNFTKLRRCDMFYRLMGLIRRSIQGIISRLSTSQTVSSWIDHLLLSLPLNFTKLWRSDIPDHLWLTIPAPWSVRLVLQLIGSLEQLLGRYRKWDSRDIIAAESVVWLLEQTEYPDATFSALDATLRLPSDLLYSLISKREDLLQRLITFHDSLLLPAGEKTHEWIASWDDKSMLSSMALFHILKARRSTYTMSRVSAPSGSLVDEDRISEEPAQLARVVLAGSLYLGHPSRTHFNDTRWLLSCLKAMKPKPLQSIRLGIDVGDMRQASTANILSISVTPLHLAMDAVAWRAMHWFWWEPKIEQDLWSDILQALHHLLEAEGSIDVVNYVAISVAAIQWRTALERGLDIWGYPTTAVQKKLESALIRSSYYFDKSPMLLDNVARAISLVDVADDDPIPKIYCRILVTTEHLFPQVLESYPNFSQSLLRLSRKDIGDTQDTVIRLLSKYRGWKSEIHTLNEYVTDLVRLLRHAVSSSFYQRDSNKSAVDEILDQFAEQFDANLFRAIFISSEGLFSNNRDILSLSTTSTPFLRRMLALSASDPAYSLTFHGVRFTVAIKLVAVLHGLHKERSGESSNSNRAVATFLRHVMANNSAVPRWSSYFPNAVLEAIDGMMLTQSDHGLSPYLSFASIINQDYLPRRVADIPDDLRLLWLGSSALVLWQFAHKELQNCRLNSDWRDVAFFEVKVVDMMLEYHQHVIEKSYGGIDYAGLHEYFTEALRNEPRLNKSGQSSVMWGNLHGDLNWGLSQGAAGGSRIGSDMGEEGSNVMSDTLSGAVVVEERRRRIQEVLESIVNSPILSTA